MKKKTKKIKKFEIEREDGSIDRGPGIEPLKKPSLKKGEKGDWQKEGYKLSHSVNTFGMDDKPEHHQHNITVKSPDNKVAGSFIIENVKGKWMPTSSQVGEEHRRKGIASSAYSHFEAQTGFKLHPHESRGEDKQSPDAKALWNQPNKTFGKEDLEKGIKDIALAGAMALAPTAANAPIAEQSKNTATPTWHAPMAQEQKQEEVKFAPGLERIAMIESSGGKNKAHVTVNYGLNRGHTAGGYTGLMPITVIETIKKNPELNKKYGHILKLKPDAITAHVNHDENFEKEIANSHWNRLGKVFGEDEARKAFAWNQGITGAKRASEETIKNHPYTIKYMETYAPKKGAALVSKTIKERWSLLKTQLENMTAFMNMKGEDEEDKDGQEQSQEDRPAESSGEAESQTQEIQGDENDVDSQMPQSSEQPDAGGTDLPDSNEAPQDAPPSIEEQPIEEQPEQEISSEEQPEEEQEISEEEQIQHLKDKGYSDPEIAFILHGHHPGAVSKEEAETHKHTQGLTHKNNEHQQALDHRETEADLRHEHMKRMNDNEFEHDTELKRLEREHKAKELALKLKLMEQQAKESGK